MAMNWTASGADADAPLAHSARPLPPLKRQILLMATAYWGLEFIIASLLFWTVGVDPVRSAAGKLSLIAFNILVTSIVTWIILTMRAQSFPVRALVALLLSVFCAPLYAMCDTLLQLLYYRTGEVHFDLINFGYTTTYGLSLYFAWSCLILSLSFLRQMRESERALALVREEALSAQMRALRYQVNPHFLFNTLNSIAGLIEEGAAGRARTMALSLSGFLRTTLEMDPLADVPLSAELAMQRDYLEIEHERFPDRLRFHFEIEPGCEAALVPNLILQPLIENAIKHGLSRSSREMTLLVRAERLDGALQLFVENDVPDADGALLDGMGIGLGNVESRLKSRFGGLASVSAGRMALARFQVAIIMPWRVY